MGKWKPGQSGNPKGKPPGTGEVQKLRAAIGEHIPEIVAKLAAAAKSGDTKAARLLLERFLPPVKPVEQAEPVSLEGETLSEQGRAVMSAAAAGELPPTQAAALIGALGNLARVVEVDDLERRIRALEAANAKE